AFDVDAGGGDHFVIGNISSPQAAGAAFSITITAKDSVGNTVTGFGGTVALSTTAGTSGPSTSGPFAAGVRTESVSVTQVGTGKTITAPGGGGIGVSNA